jgi:O-antigen/teichoic acid export membrane protein
VIARNSLLSAVGVVTPLVVGVLVVPVLTAGLGPARFGLLSIIWALLEYSALFDIGLSRATTHAVAVSLARGEGSASEEMSEVVATSLLAQLALGAVGALVIAALAQPLGSTFGTTRELAAEARASLFVLAATTPLVLLGTSLRGLLEAAQRFDLSTGIRIPSSTATLVVSAIAAAHGATVPRILALSLVVRAVTCVALGWAAHRAIPQLRWRRPRVRRHIKPLLSFGGWVATSSVISPILLYFDRLTLGAVAGLAAVGFYAAPLEIVSRLLLLAGSIVPVLFPAVSALHARGDHTALLRLLGTSVRTIMVVLLPAVCVLIAFAPTILGVWLGQSYAARSTVLLQILAVGALCNAAAYVPFTYIQALGRPDVTGRLHAAELLAYIPLTWFLVHRYGAVGAALAWTTRVAVDAALVAVGVAWVLRVSPRRLLTPRAAYLALSGVALLAALAGAAAGVRRAPVSALVGGAAAVALFAAAAWRYAMDEGERRLVWAAFGRGRRHSLGTPT